MPHTRLGLPLLIVLAVSAGCAGSAAPPAPTPTVSATTSPTAEPTITPAAPPPSGSKVPTPSGVPTITPTDLPTPAQATFNQPWAVATLTDVTTGEQFSVAELAASGKVVFVETMAIWCSNCRAQQKTATEALGQLDPSRVVWLGIDVETSETAGALARYRETNGFPFRYAISNVDLSRALAADFGDVVLSPPSVNVIVLGTDGRVTHLTGQHSAAEIIALSAEYGA